MLSGNPPFQMARPGDWWFNQFQEGRPDRFWKSHKRYTPNFPDVRFGVSRICMFVPHVGLAMDGAFVRVWRFGRVVYVRAAVCVCVTMVGGASTTTTPTHHHQPPPSHPPTATTTTTTTTVV